MLFEGFTHHLGRQPSFQITKALDGVIAIFDLSLVFISEGVFGELLFQFYLFQSALEFVSLFFNSSDRFVNGQYFGCFICIDLRLQCLELRIFSSRHLLHFVASFLFGKVNSTLLVLFSQRESVVEFLLELAVPDLFQDICISCIIHSKSLPAMRADYILHGSYSCLY